MTVKYSRKAERLFEDKKFQRSMKGIMEQVGLFALGKSSEQLGSTARQSPVQKAFGPWKGGGNKRTRTFDKYKPKYAELKTRLGKKNFLKLTGKLFKDVVENAKVKATYKNVTITAASGGSSKYQGVHQKGDKSRNIPARPFYKIDSSDEIQIREFIVKRLADVFNRR